MAILCIVLLFLATIYATEPDFPITRQLEPTICGTINRAVSTWSEWLAWGSCSVTCGVGARQRTRTCEPGEGANPLPCPGSPDSQTEACIGTVSLDCAVAEWSKWTDWSHCTNTCPDMKGGTSVRYRECGSETGGGCSGNSTQITPCSTWPWGCRGFGRHIMLWSDEHPTPVHYYLDITDGGALEEAPPAPNLPSTIAGNEFIPYHLMFSGFHQGILISESNEENAPFHYWNVHDENQTWLSIPETVPIFMASGDIRVAIGKRVWFTGGQINNVMSRKTAFLDSKGIFTAGPDLPNPNRLHSLVTISATEVLLIGGFGSLQATFRYNDIEQTFTSLANAINPIYGAFSGLVRMNDGRDAVICAGSETKTYVQIYDIGSDVWTVRPDLELPHHLGSGVTVVSDNRFFTLGGWDTTLGPWTRSDAVYELRFREPNLGWEKLQKSLPFGAIFTDMIVLPFPKPA